MIAWIGKRLFAGLRRGCIAIRSLLAFFGSRHGGRLPSNSQKNDEISAWEIVKGALTSEVFWGLNLALLLIMWYPVVYLMAIFLAEGTMWKPLLLAGLYGQCGMGAAYAAYRSYGRQRP